MTKANLQCPACGGQFDPAHSMAVPFCSQRCRQIDLGRWLDERQSLPVLRDPEDDLREDDLIDEDTDD